MGLQTRNAVILAAVIFTLFGVFLGAALMVSYSIDMCAYAGKKLLEKVGVNISKEFVEEAIIKYGR